MTCRRHNDAEMDCKSGEASLRARALSFRTCCFASDELLRGWKSRSLISNAIKIDASLQRLPFQPGQRKT